MRSLALAVLLALPLSAEACPPPPPIAAETDAIFEAIRRAPSAVAAEGPSAALWALWLTAPDTAAQEMLDEGLAARREGDPARATAAFDALVDYCPDYAEGYNQRAFTAYLSGDFAGALTDLDAAIDRSPRHVGALAGKGLTLIELGRPAEARAVLERAVALNPWIPERRLLRRLPGRDL